ncbi:F-box/kelch-repeat protein At3g06240-like [Rutidosis leptorrhynchoides]|uniref:F-box/kelch-repeat protein At3g06240-like n=1 Tax=Rutidosis leptorrhynchoides TaxID=125765 RepID=UPI003A999B25
MPLAFSFSWFWCKVKRCLRESKDDLFKDDLLKDDLLKDIPDDVLLHILIRLPVESIGRCMCVRKHWRSLLKSPSFASLYHNSTNNGRNRYLSLWKNECQLQFHHDNQNYDNYKLFTFPFAKVYNFPYSNCMEICNGLICFARDSLLTPPFVLWNPVIQKVLVLPPTNGMWYPNGMPYHLPLRFQHLGFAFDSLTNDYKIVTIRYYGKGIQSHLEIFSLNNDSWKYGPCQIDPNYSFDEKPPSTFNGGLHWLANHDIGDTCVIFGFNVNTESFRHIQVPDILNAGSIRRRRVERRVKLVVYKDSSLGMLCEDGFEHNVSLQLWVMKDYGVIDSWTNIWKFQLFNWSSFSYAHMDEDIEMNFEVYGRSKKMYGEMCTYENAHLIYDLRGEEDLKIANIKRLVASHILRPIQESLVLLDNVYAENVKCRY